MTTFSKEQVPTTINTVEKLIVWASAIVYQNNKTVSVVEGTGSPARAAQFGIFNVESNNTTRVIARTSLELEDSFAIDGKPIWENAKELSVGTIPTEFLPAA
jgi:hypothetical protein